MSLVELVCAVAIFGVATTAIGSAMVVSAQSYSRGTYELDVQQEAQITTNLIGNLVALTPMALFLPMFIGKCKKFKYFLLTTTLIVISIELLQFALVTGACDIDDLILNISGACIAYFILKTKPITKLVNKLIPHN